MEVDGIILSRQGLERSRAQGLGLPQQGHVLWAAEGQAGKAGSPAGIGRRGSRPQMALPISLLSRPPTQWGNRHVVERRCLPGTGQPGRAQVPGRILVASPGADLCTRPSSASEASGAANRRHLCSRPRCRRRSRVVVRRSGHSISHSGLSGQRAQNPETPAPPTSASARSHLLLPEQPGRRHVLVIHECGSHGPVVVTLGHPGRKDPGGTTHG